MWRSNALVSAGQPLLTVKLVYLYPPPPLHLLPGLFLRLFIFLPGQGSICKRWIKVFVGGRFKWFVGEVGWLGGERRVEKEEERSGGKAATAKYNRCSAVDICFSAAVECETARSQYDLLPDLLPLSSLLYSSPLWRSSFISGCKNYVFELCTHFLILFVEQKPLSLQKLVVEEVFRYFFSIAL